jgi:hypothetical protein
MSEVATIIEIEGDTYTIRMPNGDIKKVNGLVRGQLEYVQIPPGDVIAEIDNGDDRPKFELRSIPLVLSDELKIKYSNPFSQET